MKQNNFNKLINLIFKKQKVLAQIYKRHGHLSVFDYVNSWPKNTLTTQNQKIFLKAVIKEAKKNYPKNLVSKLETQLKKDFLFSTIDHLGLLNHPFFINSNLILSLREEKIIPVLATESVSLNNSSWPGCLVKNVTDDDKLQRFSFFPDQQKMRTVFKTPAIAKEQIKKVIHKINNTKNLSGKEKIKLQNLLEEIFNNKKILKSKNFSNQACLLSYNLWQKFFSNAPKVVTLSLEKIVTTLILSEILPNKKHLLHKLFLTKKGHKLLEKYFAAWLGAFTQNKKGSFLFWAVDNKGRRVQLEHKNDLCIGDKYKFKLTPKIIKQELLKEKIYPNSLVCFLILLYYGATCVGGFNQVNWLTEIKKKFALLLKTLHQENLATKILEQKTDNFAEGGLVFLQIFDNKKIVTASGLDIYLSEINNPLWHFINLSKKLKLFQSIDSRLPEIYRVITPVLKQKHKLLKISDQDIIKNFKLF